MGPFEIVRSLFEVLAIIFILYGFIRENRVIAWEQKQWKRFKRFLRKQLRKSPRIVAWAEKPTKHEISDDEFTVVQIKVSGDVWK